MLTRSTIGKLMIEEALPEAMRGRNLTFDKKTVQSVLRELAEKHPDRYVEVSKKLADIGRQVATETGGYSFGLEALRQPESAKKTINEIRQKVKAILATPKLNDKQRQEAIVKTVGGYHQGLMQDIYKESLAAKNPIAMQIMSGSRGNVMNLASLLGSDLLYEDHRGDIVPLPVLHSYSQGLSPAEYWAGTYGARKSVIATKFATADAGFFGKQLNQVAHRLAVVDDDDPRQDLGVRGFPVDTEDMDNEGALLAHDFGGYKRNTVLTPKILKDLKTRGFDRLLVRSPLTGGSPDGGVYARDVGIRERGALPGRGEMVGMTAAQAIAEPISQGQLSAKHSGGVAGQEKTVGGFQYIDQLIQVPKTFKGGAAHTTVDGRVQKIEDAPAGGRYVFVNDKPQYVGQGFDIKVKPGDDVEAGDVLSEGIPNPSIITQYKGIGEGRRYFTKTFRDAMGSMGLRSHRRNIELIGRGLIDHVRLTEEYGDHVPDDVIPYSSLEHTYKPRDGALTTTPDRALNKYLEKPVLHYTIGTQIRPSMLKDFKYFGVNDVTVHDKPAPFEPEMVRAMYNLHHDPDWMTRMYGSGLKGSLLEATHRGSTSTATGTSFVPGLAKGMDFGRVGVVKQPKPGLKPELNTPAPSTPATPEKQSSDDILPGGIGDKYNVSDFDPKAMKKGIKTEMEHTISPEIAADISKDHLTEDPKYYDKLQKQEKKSTYSIAGGIARARNKQADDKQTGSIKPNTGSSTAKPSATTGAPPAPQAPTTNAKSSITPPQLAPATGNSAPVIKTPQTQPQSFIDNSTDSTIMQNEQTPTTSAVQTPNPVTPQQVSPVTPPPANQITPSNTLPAPTQTSSEAAPPPVTVPYRAPGFSGLQESDQTQPSYLNQFASIGQAMKDIGMLTNANQTDSNLNWSYNYMSAADKLRGQNVNFIDDAVQTDNSNSTASNARRIEQEAQMNVALPPQLKQQIIDEGDKARANPQFQTTKQETRLTDLPAQVARDFGVPTAVILGKEHLFPKAVDSGAALYQKKLQDMAMRQFGSAAVPAATAETSIVKNLINTPKAVGSNLLHGLTAPIRNPITNLAIDTAMTAIQNKSYNDIMANADAYGTRFKDMMSGLRSGTVTGTLGGLGQGALAGAGIAFNPADAIQTATYAAASPSSTSEEGKSMRRHSQADAAMLDRQRNADIPGYVPITQHRTWDQYFNRPNALKTTNTNTPEVQNVLATRKMFDAMSPEQLETFVSGLHADPENDANYIASVRNKFAPEQRFKFDSIKMKQDAEKLKQTDPAAYAQQQANLREREAMQNRAAQLNTATDAEALKFYRGLIEDVRGDDEKAYVQQQLDAMPSALRQRLQNLYSNNTGENLLAAPEPSAPVPQPVSRPWRMS